MATLGAEAAAKRRPRNTEPTNQAGRHQCQGGWPLLEPLVPGNAATAAPKNFFAEKKRRRSRLPADPSFTHGKRIAADPVSGTTDG